MASIVSSGIGSGIDIDGLLKQLVQAQGQASGTRLNSREAGFQAKLSALGSFKGALESLKTALQPLKDLAKFQGRSVTVGDTKVLTASAGSTAVPGVYNVEVERLAAAHRIRSGGYTAESTVIGTGTLTIAMAGSSVGVTVDSTSNTLAGIRDAINKAGGGLGVQATIVNETGVGYRLLLSSSKTGAANTITVTQSGGDGGLAPLVASFATVTAAANSRIVVDGLAHESATNTVTTAVTGLTFTPLSVSAADVTTPVTVTFDKAGASKLVNDFVAAYNALNKSLRSLSSYDATAKVAGPLFGDATLRDFRAALSRELGARVTGISSSFASLAEIGVVSKVDGSLETDSAKLDAFLVSSFDDVGKLFSNASSTAAPVDGLARRLDALIERHTKVDGLIENRTKGLQVSIEEIGEARQTLNKRLAELEDRLRKQFSAMDALVAQLRSTGNFLTQQVTALNGSATR